MHLITKRVTAYPAYAYQKPGDESTWRFRLRVWVSKPWPAVPERLLRLLVPDAREGELLLLQTRATDFLANADEDARRIFDAQPEPTKWLRLTVRAVGRLGRLNDGSGAGKVRFLEPDGL